MIGGLGVEDVRMSELRAREGCAGVGVLGLGLGDGGGWVDARVDGVSADGDGWVMGFGVEVLEVDGVIGSGHWIWH